MDSGKQRRRMVGRICFRRAALIVFSVLLALAVNEWRAEKARAQKAQTAIDAIHSELEANREEFQDAMEYHTSMRDTLMYYQKQDSAPPMALLYQGIFNPATVYNTAWETAKQSGVTDNFDYKLVLDLSHLYGRQTNYKGLSSAIGQNFYVKMTMEKSGEELLQDNYENWIVLLGDFSRREEGFAKSNYEMSKKLNKIIGLPSPPDTLKANSGDGQITLTWEENSEDDLRGYSVYRSEASFTGVSDMEPVNESLIQSTEFSDDEVENGKTYYYRLTAVGRDGNESITSLGVKVTPVAN